MAAHLRVAPSTVHDEVTRLQGAGMLATRSIGRAKMVRASTESRLAKPLSELLLLTFGPRLVVDEEFSGIGGLQGLLLYGSWAARYAGDAGAIPGDVDVMVIGKPDRADVYAAADRAQARLGFPVDPTVRTWDQWVGDSDALVVSVKAGPFLELHAPSEGES